jgi:curved DNA-binding protein
MPIYRREGSHGDLIVTCSVTIPTTLTACQRELYEELQKESLA